MKDTGFSLIELIVVIAIISILLAIAAISGSSWLQRYYVENQTKEMYADLMNARVSALQRNRPFFVKMAPNQYAIYEDTYSAATPTSPEGDGLLQTANDRLVMQKTIRYTLNSSIDITATNIVFSTNGLAFPDGTTIWFTSTADPATDCIALSTTRILMGKKNGTNCTSQ